VDLPSAGQLRLLRPELARPVSAHGLDRLQTVR